MVCNEQCLKLFGLDQAKQTPITKEFNIVGETIRRGDIHIEHAHLTKLNKDFCPSTSDLGSESDSGLGSVRTSKKESDSQDQFHKKYLSKYSLSKAEAEN
jgi:hypothetical protein